MYQLFYLLWVVTLISFIVFWWKKRKAKKEAGDDYQNSEKYLDFSKKKRTIGFACIGAFVLVLLTQPDFTPEEKARMNAQYEASKQKNSEKENAEQEFLNDFKSKEYYQVMTRKHIFNLKSLEVNGDEAKISFSWTKIEDNQTGPIIESIYKKDNNGNWKGKVDWKSE